MISTNLWVNFDISDRAKSIRLEFNEKTWWNKLIFIGISPGKIIIGFKCTRKWQNVVQNINPIVSIASHWQNQGNCNWFSLLDPPGLVKSSRPSIPPNYQTEGGNCEKIPLRLMKWSSLTRRQNPKIMGEVKISGALVVNYWFCKNILLATCSQT